MAEIQPFRAFRYNTDRVALKDVLTQPYDKISPAMQERYYAASPANLIAIEKGNVFEGDTPRNNVYTRAAAKLEEWIAGKILVQDAAPSVYIYSQEYFVPGTHSRRERIGFIALGRLEDYDAKVVFRHERTLSAPKADRMELLRHTRAQTGQLFMLYDDPTRRIEVLLEETAHKNAPLELRDEYDVLHRLWPVSDQAFARRIQKEMSDKKLVIADGHHRYETALNYRNERRAKRRQDRSVRRLRIRHDDVHQLAFEGIDDSSHAPARAQSRRISISSGFARPSAPILTGTHIPFRMRKSAPRATPNSGGTSRDAAASAAQSEFTRAEFPSEEVRRTAARCTCFCCDATRTSETLLPDLSEAQRQLDVVLLHRLILDKGLGITAEAVTAEKNMSYEREMDAAVAAVDKGDAQLACLLNPVRVQQVMDIALGGDVLPQKSTDFYPKMLSGVAIYRVED